MIYYLRDPLLISLMNMSRILKKQMVILFVEHNILPSYPIQNVYKDADDKAKVFFYLNG